MGKYIAGLKRSYKKHGHGGYTRTVTYNCWDSMKRRTTNPRNKYFKNYGGRGIRVCVGWLDSFPTFLADMGEKPDGLWLDRIDNEGHYSCGHCDECIENGWPLNCRWATPAEQLRNTRRNLYLTFQGRTQLLVDWAAEVGLPSAAINMRLRRGWTLEKSLTTPNLRKKAA